MSQMSHAEMIEALKALANRWTLKARDHARESKVRTSAQDANNAFYHRGVAETYHKAALDLAQIITGMGDAPAEAQPAQPTPSAAAAPQPEVIYAPVSLNEVMSLLEYAGVTARDVNRHKDNAFTAIFSRWQPFSDAERLERIQKADPRIIILDSGRLRDTSDPYVDFAFKA